MARRDNMFDRTRRLLDNPGASDGNLEDRISGGPPTGQEEDEGPSPLGVPRDYEVAVQNQNRPGYYPHGFNYRTRTYGAGARPEDPSVVIGPRYFDGDEWKPSQLSPARVAQLQRAMATAGLLSEFRLGIWDSRSAKAYAEVLSFANAAGLTDQMALSQMVNSPELSMGGSGSGGGGGRRIIGFDENGDPIYSEYTPPPLELKTTNKDDLRHVFRTAVIDRMGEGWTQAQINELVDAYNWQEVKVQQDAYNQRVALERTAFEQGDAAVAGQVISQESTPSPEAFVESEMLRRDPVGVQAGGVINEALPMFLNALKGWA